MQYDLAVVGGSFAGLSAAIQVARAGRKVLVIDAGQPRNRFAEHSHGFLGQDGRAPGAILADARRQLLAYPTARVVDGRADKAVAAGSSDFEITTDGDETFGAARLVLATGVRDILPEVAGLAELWGRSVLHCPYCHGYEVSGGPLGVLANRPDVPASGTADRRLGRCHTVRQWPVRTRHRADARAGEPNGAV